MAVQLRDMVVLLPGIGGSVLQRHGTDAWAISGQASWRALATLGRSIADLALDGDDHEVDDLDDGVTATKLMAGTVIVPGLKKVNGYSATSEWLRSNFEVVQGSIDDPPEKAANFYEFPYDWRRDVRVAARKLERLVAARLPRWRTARGADDAKVVLLAHSMGGLVARHYVEVMGGWEHCRALVTFGTPHRGSVSALEFLANGYKKAFVDLTELMRSFTSVHQLLPIYPVLDTGTSMTRVAETRVDGVNADAAAEALAFHRAIEAAVAENRRDLRYRDEFSTLVVVGTHQMQTLQSARMANGQVTTGTALPPGVPAEMDGGDGTVPMISAVPLELSTGWFDTFVPERHSSIHLPVVLGPHLLERLKKAQAPGLAQIRGDLAAERPDRRAISVRVDDLYLPGEPVELGARLINFPSAPGGVRVTVTPVGGDTTRRADMAPVADDQWSVSLEGLPAGVYAVEVRARQVASGATLPAPVHDIFEVGG